MVEGLVFEDGTLNMISGFRESGRIYIMFLNRRVLRLLGTAMPPVPSV